MYSCCTCDCWNGQEATDILAQTLWYHTPETPAMETDSLLEVDSLFDVIFKLSLLLGSCTLSMFPTADELSFLVVSAAAALFLHQAE